VFANEPIGGSPEGKRKTKEVIKEATGCSVKNICEHDVHGVFGTYGACTEHGEAKLHGEHKVGGEEEICVVHGILGGGEVVSRGVELGADEISSPGGVSNAGAQ